MDELATDGGGLNEAPLMLEVELLAAELLEDCMEMEFIAEVSDALDSLWSPGDSGASRATIFIPRDSPVLAGINSVVTPFRLMTVR